VLKTFKKGGVHPAENKISASAALVYAQIPKTAIVPVSQHIGAPATVLVNKGDMVKTGQLIAQSSGFVSANIHAPVSGTVAKVEDVIDASGFRKTAIHITTAGDEWMEGINRSTELVKTITEEPTNILKKIQEAGIVGLGGATFPSHVKLAVPTGKKAEVLIINGVECEPYLTADHRLMLEKSHELMVGIQILMKALQVGKAYIGIENNKPDAIEKLAALQREYTGIEIVPLKVKYPQGGEKQLINAITGREVPSGKLPIDVGAVVHNVATAFAVYEAVQKNKPLIDRVVTVTGESVKRPLNIVARIGTPVSELIQLAEADLDKTFKVISGGPMMGKALMNLDAPVTKGTSGILLMGENSSKRNAAGPCIRCAKCVEVCPMGLEPYLLMTLTDRQIWENVEERHVMDCIECGSCMYTCPASRPLLDYIRLGKSTVGKIIRSRKQ
jgi:electron transport complex protein RnfC